MNCPEGLLKRNEGGRRRPGFTLQYTPPAPRKVKNLLIVYSQPEPRHAVKIRARWHSREAGDGHKKKLWTQQLPADYGGTGINSSHDVRDPFNMAQWVP